MWPRVRVALLVVLEVVADHEGLAASVLLALVWPLVGVGAVVLFEVRPKRIDSFSLIKKKVYG